MADVLARNIHTAKRSVAAALSADSDDKFIESYWQYLQCMSMIVQTLVQDLNTQGLANFRASSYTEKYVRLGQQCLERIEALVEKIGGQQDLPMSPPPAYTSMPPQMSPSADFPTHQRSPWQQNQHQPPSQPRQASPWQQSPQQPSPWQQAPPQSPWQQQGYHQSPHTTSRVAPGVPDGHNRMAMTVAASPQTGIRPSTTGYQTGNRSHVTGSSSASAIRARNQMYRSRSIELNLSLQRKLMENAEIAKARKAALKRKMEEQHKRLEEEGKKRYWSAEDQVFYAQVMQYEQKAVWPVAWRERLSQTPEDERLFETLIQHILRTPDHPITAEVIKHRYELFSRISPLVVQYVSELDKVKVVASVGQGQGQIENCRKEEDEKSADGSEDYVKIEKEELDMATKFTPVRGVPANLNDFKDLSMPDSIFDDDSSENESENETKNETGDKKETDVVLVESSHDETRDANNDLQAKATNEDRDDSNEFTVATSESNAGDIDHNSGSGRKSPLADDMNPNDEDHNDIATTDDGQNAIATGDVAMDSGLRTIPNMEEYTRNLKVSVEQVRSSLAELQHRFVVAYHQLDTPGGRLLVSLCIEDVLFQQLWQYIITLYRLANLDKELKLSKLMTRYYGCMPQDFGVREKFTLLDADSDESLIPYHAAVAETQKIAQLQSPVKKLESLVKVSVDICKAVQDHFARKPDDDQHSSATSIGADDLIPILTYVIVQAGHPQLVSECAALDEFIREDFLHGEEGYALASFNTCLNHLLNKDQHQPED